MDLSGTGQVLVNAMYAAMIFHGAHNAQLHEILENIAMDMNKEYEFIRRCLYVIAYLNEQNMFSLMTICTNELRNYLRDQTVPYRNKVKPYIDILTGDDGVYTEMPGEQLHFDLNLKETTLAANDGVDAEESGVSPFSYYFDDGTWDKQGLISDNKILDIRLNISGKKPPEIFPAISTEFDYTAEKGKGLVV